MNLATAALLSGMITTSGPMLGQKDGPVVCADPGQRLTMFVRFAAEHEHGLRIVDAMTGRTVVTFNNYYGRGADSFWRRGPGVWTTPPTDRPRCYHLYGQFKQTAPGARGTWYPSRVDVRHSGAQIGFKDYNGGDRDDATVDVIRNTAYAAVQ